MPGTDSGLTAIGCLLCYPRPPHPRPGSDPDAFTWMKRAPGTGTEGGFLWPGHEEGCGGRPPWCLAGWRLEAWPLGLSFPTWAMVQGSRFLRPFSSEILSLGKSLESVSQSLTQVTSEGARSALASALGLNFPICTMENLCSFVAADPFPSVKWYQAVETTGLPEAGVGLSGFKSSAELLCASVSLSVKWTKSGSSSPGWAPRSVHGKSVP